jgi:hypothetical protein
MEERKKRWERGGRRGERREEQRDGEEEEEKEKTIEQFDPRWVLSLSLSVCSTSEWRDAFGAVS